MSHSDFSSGFLSDFTSSAYTSRYNECGAIDRMRSLLFHRLLSTMRSIADALHRQHPAPHTPEGSSVLFLQTLHTFLGLRFYMTSSAPSCSLFRANLSTLPSSLVSHSLYVTVCCFAPLSQGGTTLQHTRSPRCIDCLLPGLWFASKLNSCHDQTFTG